MKSKKQLKLGVIGMGRMGKCLVEGVVHSGTFPKEVVAFTTKHLDTGERVTNELEIQRCKSNQDLVEQSDVLVLAVKPQNLKEALAEVSSLPKGKTFISIVAGASIQELEDGLGKGAAIVRAMPNTPAFVREGMTALCLGSGATEQDHARASEIFKSVGRVVQVDERHMNAVTGLSGCGPAYLYLVLEALTDGGIKVGLPRDLSSELAAQTVLGAAKMLLETGRHPAALKDEVTTPAGCTIDGLVELEEGKVRVTLIKAVVKATERAKSLS